MIELADRGNRISPSMTFAIASKAKALRAQGVDVCDFSVGEPDFNTPELMREAAKAALDAGKTKYTPTAGLPELRSAIAEKLRRDNGLAYAPEQVMVTVGGKQALFNTLMVLLNPGDEAIVPTPAWVTYLEIVKLTGAKAVFVAADETNGFKLRAQQLADAITPRTRALILNSPCNPTGAVYTAQEIEALAEVIVEQQIVVISDEIYEKLIYDGLEHVSIGSLRDEVHRLTVTCSGFSKAFAATGWRIGFAAGPTAVVKAATALQSHSTSGATTFAQYGALAALRAASLRETVEEMRTVFQARRDLVVSELQQIPGLTCGMPHGSFYVFPNIGQMGLDSMTFCERLLDAEQVATVPGVAFGADSNVRISYATDTGTLREGLARLRRFAASLV